MTKTTNGWHVLEMATHVAIVPDYEDGHVLTANGCWCEPAVKRVDPETGVVYVTPTVTHRDIGERNGRPADHRLLMDATEIGLQAARVMGDLDDDARAGELGEDARVVGACVIYEVQYTHPDGELRSVVGMRTTDDRGVVALGLMERGRDAVLRPVPDP